MQWPRWSEVTLALVALCVAGLIGYGVGRGGSQPTGHITVTANGTSNVTPNLGQINLGAQATATTAQGALDKVNSIAQKVVAAIQKDGVAAADIQTSNLNEGQNWTGQAQPSGYRASENFTITIRKLGAIGGVIDAAFHAGANQFQSVSYSETDPNAGRRAAVQQALAAAKKQAQAEAKELGVTLGKVTSVQVQGQSTPIPIYAAAKTAAASATVVRPGTQTVNVQVVVTYSFR